jgi:ADP-ribose pyrophosphatase YjhB (NUDIX family)
MTMKNQNKVVAYITKDTKLLVFDHADFPEAGTQVPAGTIEDGETPTFAVMREVVEETGLNKLYLRDFLGMQTLVLEKPEGKMAINRHYYHFEVPDDVPDTWAHYETKPSDGALDLILFNFRWIDFSKDNIILAGKQDFFLRLLDNKLKK